LHLIAGLGNPGIEYEETRHNVGFMIIDCIASAYGIAFSNKGKFKSLLGRGTMGGVSVILLKPRTFMNRSGVAVKAVQDYFNIPISNLLVIYDDINLPFGHIRIRRSGGTGGHNGMRSIMDHIQSSEFPRIRVGIGEPRRGDVSDFVLNRFTGEEKKGLEEVIEMAKGAARMIQIEGIEKAMNAFN